jgi:hypothetical protein|tara:strand:- start:1424 stop:1831 length:408 start_codon:yes stop_codon:yes gene_type:complete
MIPLYGIQKLIIMLKFSYPLNIMSQLLSDWKIEKGVYNPPLFDNVHKRVVRTSPHIDRNIHKLIGKDGIYFIEITKRFNLLYIFYIDRKIEIYGTNLPDIHHAVHHFIREIKRLNNTLQDALDDSREENKAEISV